MKITLWLLLCAAAFAQNPSNSNVVIVGNPAQPVQPIHQKSIQDAITAAGPTGTVIIPADWSLLETYSNPGGLPMVIDLRGGIMTVNGVAFGSSASLPNPANFPGDVNVGCCGFSGNINLIAGKGQQSGNLTVGSILTAGQGLFGSIFSNNPWYVQPPALPMLIMSPDLYCTYVSTPPYLQICPLTDPNTGRTVLALNDGQGTPNTNQFIVPSSNLPSGFPAGALAVYDPGTGRNIYGGLAVNPIAGPCPTGQVGTGGINAGVFVPGVGPTTQYVVPTCVNPIDMIVGAIYAVATASPVNAVQVAVAQGNLPTSLTGLAFCYVPPVGGSNTIAAPTLQVAPFAAKTITKNGAWPLNAGDVNPLGACVRYDGTQFELLNPTTRGMNVSVALSSNTTISTTSLCSTALCTAGTYRVSVYIETTNSCTTGGAYVPFIAWNDDNSAARGGGASGGGYFPLSGIAQATTQTGTLTLNGGPPSYSASGVQHIRTPGTANAALGAINYGATATACATGGPVTGTMIFTVEPE